MVVKLEPNETHSGEKLGFNQIQGACCCFIWEVLSCIFTLHIPAWHGCPVESTDGDCQSCALSPQPPGYSRFSSWCSEYSYFPTILKISLKYIFWKVTFLDVPSSNNNKVSKLGWWQEGLSQFTGKTPSCGLFVKAYAKAWHLNVQ